ncbi:MAG TPA: tetratricopeptide repeat protein [Bacteroidales bacterium]|nr:tetratricopeptide repeat protein [Bacteroidales bacterium]
MKIKFLILFVVLICHNLTYGQKTQAYNEMETLWTTAEDLFNKGMYVPAQKLFAEILLDEGQEYSAYKDDAAFYIALCSMNLFNKDAEYQISGFIAEHPESHNSNDAAFQMANYYFRIRKYKDALEWYDKTDRLSLTKDEQSEYFFKTGFSHFARSDFDRAAKAFYESKEDKTIYGPMSLYFYSHIKYISEQYQTALLGFLELEKSPTFSAIAPFYITQIYYLQEKYDDVIAYAPKMIDTLTGARAAETNKILGSSYYRKGKYAESLPYLNTYLKNTSSATDYDYYEIGYAYYITKQYEAAANSFSKITKMQDTLSQYAAYHLGDCYLKMGKKVDARLSFEMAAQYNYNPAIREDALFNYAQLCFELSMSPFNEAINAFLRYIKEYPKSLRTDQAYDYLLDAFLSTKNYQRAITVIEEMPGRNSKIDAVYQRLTYFRGLEYFTESKFSEAIGMFDKSLKYGIYDKTIQALSYYWKAEANYRLDKIDEAINQYKEFVNVTGSVSLDEYGKAHYNLGYAYFNKKEYATANSWFRKFEMQPGYENTVILNDAMNRIADCYFISKEFGPAADYYKKAAAIGKIMPDYTLYQMALSYGGLKQSNEKIWSLRRLLQLYPDSEYAGNANFEIGRTYHISANNTDSAKYYYNKLIVNYPNSSMKKAAMSSIAAIYFSEKDYNKAMDLYKQVIAEYPNTEESANANEMIRAIYIEIDNPDGYIDYANSGVPGVTVSVDEQDEIMWLAAKKLYIDKNYNEALNSLTNYLLKFPQGRFCIEANYFKAELHYYFEEKDQALVSYRIVADASRGSYTEESTIKAASILYDKKQWQEAYNYYNKLYPISENKSTKLLAAIGKLRCAYFMQNYDDVIAAATEVIENEKSNQEQVREAHYKMAKSYYAKGNLIRSLNLFENLSVEVKSSEGAESMFMVAQINYEMKKDSVAEDLIYGFAQANSPHGYWLAKSFILLSDIYYDRGDNFSAKHTLQSLLNNYTNETDGIKDITSEKLTKIIDEEQADKGVEELLNLRINMTEDGNEKLFEEETIIDLPKPAEIRNIND